jgi:hypothetical protein
MRKMKYSWRGVIMKVFNRKGRNITKQVGRIAYDGCADGEEPDAFAAYKEGEDGLPMWVADFKDIKDAAAFCHIWDGRSRIASDKKHALNMRMLAGIKNPDELRARAETLLLAILDSCGYDKTVKEYNNLKNLKAG